MLSRGAYQTEIVLFEIADIIRNFSSFAIFISDIIFGIILKQSRSLLFSMFHSFIFPSEAAKRQSAFLSSSKVKWVIGELSMGVTVMF